MVVIHCTIFQILSISAPTVWVNRLCCKTEAQDLCAHTVRLFDPCGQCWLLTTVSKILFERQAGRSRRYQRRRRRVKVCHFTLAQWEKGRWSWWIDLRLCLNCARAWEQPKFLTCQKFTWSSKEGSGAAYQPSLPTVHCMTNDAQQIWNSVRLRNELCVPKIRIGVCLA